MDNKQLARRLVRLLKTQEIHFTTLERSFLKEAARAFNDKTKRKRGRATCALYLGDLKSMMPDIEIYIDELGRALVCHTPEKLAELIVGAIIHENSHAEGFNEKQARAAVRALRELPRNSLDFKQFKKALKAMTWKLIKCPKHKKNVTWEECLHCKDAEKHPDCPDFAIRSRSTQRRYKQNIYHVTELISPRRSYFERKYDVTKAWTDSPAFMRFFMGKAFHRFYQEAFAPHEVEIHVERDFGDFRITGSADVVARGMLRELKTHGDLGRVTRRGPSPEHIWQAQAYYSLLNASQPHLARDVKRVKILYAGLTRADTWLEFDVPLKDITDDIRTRAKVLHKALTTNEPPTEFPCADWLCRYCDYVSQCKGKGKPVPLPLKPMKIYIKEDVQRGRGGKNPVWCIKFEESDNSFWIKFKDGKKPWTERGILFVDWLPTFEQIIEIIKFAVRYNNDIDRKIVLAVLEAAKEGKKEGAHEKQEGK